MVAVLFLSNRATEEGSRFNFAGRGGALRGSCGVFSTVDPPKISGRGGRSEGLKFAPDMTEMCSTSLMWCWRSMECRTRL